MALAATRPETLLGWMGSLADPTRLRLLRLLERNELGVLEVCEILQSPQSTVSRHLKLLADQGWLRSRAQGPNRLYRAAQLEAGARKLWLLARELVSGWATAQQDQLRLSRVLAARQPAAQAFFAGAAGQWDKLRGELYGCAFTNDALLGLLPPEWVVADLGCGSGHATVALAALVQRVIGVDQSAAMLKAAKRRAAGLRNVELRLSSLEALPLDDASVDAALLLLALSYVEDRPAALREAARAVRPGGRVVVVDLMRHDREEFRRQMGQAVCGFEAEELRGLLSRAGFGGVVSRALAPTAQAKGPALMLWSARRQGGVALLERKKREGV